jgi:SOS response associated peptidase (SRAP)
MRWGFLPHWAKDENSTFNARAGEFTAKPASRGAWKRRQRCLVVTDDFYEWKKLDPKGKEKQSYAIAMADDGQMAMAGLWAKWKNLKSGDETPTTSSPACRSTSSICRAQSSRPLRRGRVWSRINCSAKTRRGAFAANIAKLPDLLRKAAT